MKVTDLSHHHIGLKTTAQPRTDEGAVSVTGTIRWITLTSDGVTVAIEEDEGGLVEWDGPVEWDFPNDAEILVAVLASPR